jgi:hypothetical protein
MMVPMTHFVAGAESSPVRRRVWIDVHHRAVSEANNLSFATAEASVLDFNANAIRDRLQFDVGRVRDTQLREKLFGGSHLCCLTPSDFLPCQSGRDARMLRESRRDPLRRRSFDFVLRSSFHSFSPRAHRSRP